ncbi:MAG: DUF4870 domain-containing protein [Acidobacteriota bacterium]
MPDKIITDEPQFNYQEQPYSTPPLFPQGKTQVLGLDYNIAALLCYLPFGFIAAIIFLSTEPTDNRFVRFHAIQSLLVTAAWTGLFILLSILSTVFANIPFVGWVFTLILIPIYLIAGIAPLVLMVVLAIKAYHKEMWQVPFIGPYAQRLAD